MNHIKKFNESVDNMYHEISEDEWDDMWEKIVPMYNKFLEKLNSILDDPSNAYHHSDPWYNGGAYKLHRYTGSYCKVLNEFCIIPNAGQGSTMRFIYQCDDEWFIIKEDDVEDVYYKCDQFEGLLKYLKDNTKLRW